MHTLTSGNALRVCVDRFTVAAPAPDVYGEVVLDNSRGFRCGPLAIRPTAADLAGNAVDGKTSSSSYHDSGIFSHRALCSDGTAADRCSYAVAGPSGARLYSSSCDPLRSHCYWVPERGQRTAEPLWCCDFAAEKAATASHVRVELWDEAQLGDDRLGNASVATSVLHDKLKNANSSIALDEPLGGSVAQGTVNMWVGLVPATAEAASTSKSERKRRRTQISYWGAFGPDDAKVLATNEATAAAPSDSPYASRARRQAAMRNVAEWQRWQSLPMLAAEEQPPDVLARRRQAMGKEAAAAPELGMGGSGVCVVTTATGAKYDGTQPAGAALLRNKREFCAACGYRCLLSTAGNHATRRPAKWDKLAAVHDALRSCSLVMHIDADVVIRRPFQLELLARTWLSASRDYDGLNSGVLLVRRSRQVRELLDFAWRQRSFNNSFSAEQNALRLGLRRPYSASSRSRLSLVTIMEGLVEFPFYKSPLLSKLGRDLNQTAPLYHTAGCTANQGRVGSGLCDELLLKQLPPQGVRGPCASIELPYPTHAKALLQHMQEQGSTNMGRRWLRGRDLRIKYTDQKGSRHDGWWAAYQGCSEVGCDDPDARKRAEKAARKEGMGKARRRAAATAS